MKKMIVLALIISSSAFADGPTGGSGGQGGAGKHPNALKASMIPGTGQGGNGKPAFIFGGGTGGVDRSAPASQN